MSEGIVASVVLMLSSLVETVPSSKFPELRLQLHIVLMWWPWWTARDNVGIFINHQKSALTVVGSSVLRASPGSPGSTDPRQERLACGTHIATDYLMQRAFQTHTTTSSCQLAHWAKIVCLKNTIFISTRKCGSEI